MPIHEYECEKCGAVFERLHRSAGEEEVRCPACEAAACRRLISRPAAAKPSAEHSCPISPG